MINTVTLVGRLTRDPELRYTPNNVAVATFNLAVNRRFKNAAGEREADFINCVIWRGAAENLFNWTQKGALIGITGSIQTRNYESQQGQRVYITEVVVDNFQTLESRAQNEQRQTQAGGISNQPANNGGYSAPPTGNTGYASQAANSAPTNTNPGFSGAGYEISDDDLPF